MSKEMKLQMDRLNQLNKQKQKIYSAVDQATADLPELLNKKEKLKKFIHPKWNSSELVPKGMKEIKKTLETGSGGHKEEAKCIKDLAFLKESEKHIAEKEAIDARVNEI